MAAQKLFTYRLRFVFVFTMVHHWRCDFIFPTNEPASHSIGDITSLRWSCNSTCACAWAFAQMQLKYCITFHVTSQDKSSAGNSNSLVVFYSFPYKSFRWCHINCAFVISQGPHRDSNSNNNNDNSWTYFNGSFLPGNRDLMSGLIKYLRTHVDEFKNNKTFAIFKTLFRTLK